MHKPSPPAPLTTDDYNLLLLLLITAGVLLGNTREALYLTARVISVIIIINLFFMSENFLLAPAHAHRTPRVGSVLPVLLKCLNRKNINTRRTTSVFTGRFETYGNLSVSVHHRPGRTTRRRRFGCPSQKWVIGTFNNGKAKDYFRTRGENLFTPSILINIIIF